MVTPRVFSTSFSDTLWLQLGTDLRAAMATDAPVLITGQRDVGGLVARALHDRPARNQDVDFVAVPHESLYVKLASLSAGTLQLADGGQTERCTLFVDEVHLLSPASQEMLQYFLDVAYADASRSNDGPAIPAVRVITATSVDLAERVSAGLFRSDLFYRLNVIHLVMPTAWDAAEDSQIHTLLAALEA